MPCAPVCCSCCCCAGVPLSVLLIVHTYMALTSTTTHEFIKLDKIEYLRGFYE